MQHRSYVNKERRCENGIPIRTSILKISHLKDFGAKSKNDFLAGLLAKKGQKHETRYLPNACAVWGLL
jgi:hypothetical protein